MVSKETRNNNQHGHNSNSTKQKNEIMEISKGNCKRPPPEALEAWKTNYPWSISSLTEYKMALHKKMVTSVKLNIKAVYENTSRYVAEIFIPYKNWDWVANYFDESLSFHV